MVAVVPPAFAHIAGVSWRLAFALAATGPVLGVLALRRVGESRRVWRESARRPGVLGGAMQGRREPR